MVVLPVPKDPSGIAVIVCPGRGPAAAGAGGLAGPRGAGGVWLLTENLYGGIHRGTLPTGRRETRRRVHTAGGKYAGKRGGRETEVFSQPGNIKTSETCMC